MDVDGDEEPAKDKSAVKHSSTKEIKLVGEEDVAVKDDAMDEVIVKTITALSKEKVETEVDTMKDIVGEDASGNMVVDEGIVVCGKSDHGIVPIVSLSNF